MIRKDLRASALPGWLIKYNILKKVLFPPAYASALPYLPTYRLTYLPI